MLSSNGFRHDHLEYDRDFEILLNRTMNSSSSGFKNILSEDGEKQLIHTTYTLYAFLFPNAFKEGDVELESTEAVTEHIQSIPEELIHLVYNFREHTSFAEESISDFAPNSDFGRHFQNRFMQYEVLEEKLNLFDR